MKTSILPLSLFLSALSAATASAQLTPIRFAAPVNPIAGLPKLLPSPLTGPLAGTKISLPSLVPALMPSIAPAGAALEFIVPVNVPVNMPSRGNQLPAKPTQPSRDGVNNPLRRVIPGVVIRFESPAAPAAKPDAVKEKLDEEFDGLAPLSKPVVGLRRGHVSSGRHITLPEWDLERELGI